MSKGHRKAGVCLALGTGAIAATLLIATQGASTAVPLSDKPDDITEDMSENLDQWPWDPPPSTADEPSTPRNFFEPYPAGPGAIPYAELTPGQQAARDRTKEVYEADHPPAMHTAWSRGTRARAAEAKRIAAERASGLQNIDDVAVP